MPEPPRLPLPPEVAAILKKLDRLLESDNEQNGMLPEPVRSQMANGLDCDELPGAQGEFGRAPSNPIPTNGPLGQVIYLSRLRTNAGSPVMFHRVRAEEEAGGAVDVYEVLSLDGAVRETLFLSMYHPRKSRKVPRGYTYAAKLDPSNLTYGVNHIVANFPQKLDAHIRKWQMDLLGIPLPVARVRETINGSRFHPSMLDDVVDSADQGSVERQMRDDILKLVHASQDPRFKGKGVVIGIDGIVRAMPAEQVEIGDAVVPRREKQPDVAEVDSAGGEQHSGNTADDRHESAELNIQSPGTLSISDKPTADDFRNAIPLDVGNFMPNLTGRGWDRALAKAEARRKNQPLASNMDGAGAEQVPDEYSKDMPMHEREARAKEAHKRLKKTLEARAAAPSKRGSSAPASNPGSPKANDRPMTAVWEGRQVNANVIAACILGAAIVIGTVVTAGRYTISGPTANSSSVFILDRFTGQVRRCNAECEVLPPGAQ